MSRDFLTKACVQYNDATGTVALDFKDMLIWNEYLEKLGFNSGDYTAFSFEFNLQELPIVEKEREGHLVISAVNKNDVGQNLMDIHKYLSDNSNKLPVYKFYKRMTVTDFFKNFKRFNISFEYGTPYENYYQNTIEEEVIGESDL